MTQATLLALALLLSACVTRPINGCAAHVVLFGPAALSLRCPPN